MRSLLTCQVCLCVSTATAPWWMYVLVRTSASVAAAAAAAQEFIVDSGTTEWSGLNGLPVNNCDCAMSTHGSSWMGRDACDFRGKKLIDLRQCRGTIG
ncbi:hypothetical protein BC826DRAFT_1023279 [Russula brevipes]|nr:hypothetical protein BC826DRAFT_1023279 [Russula brevipes]